MIRITEQPPDLIKMEIKLHIPQIDIITFLQRKGYQIAAFSFTLPIKEEFLLNEPPLTINTFTATKPNERQSSNTLYLNVFEKEIKEQLKFN